MKSLAPDDRQACAPVTSVFLPAKLGDPAACRQFTPGQHRVIQALIRETTRSAKRNTGGINEADVVVNGLVPTFAGRASTTCPLLDPDIPYAAFNGNGRRPMRTRGYHVASAGGWMFKAGYSVGEPEQLIQFLRDLKGLSGPLSLTVVGLGKGPGDWHTLDELLGLAITPPGRSALSRLSLRVYSGADYLQRWCDVFRWTTPARRRGCRGEVDRRRARVTS